MTYYVSTRLAYEPQPTVSAFALVDKIKSEVFPAIRKELKCYARADFLCCQSCATAQLESEWEERGKKAGTKGCVYWHRQKTPQKADDEIGLHYGYFADSDRDGNGGVSGNRDGDRELAQAIVAILERFGIVADWDGSPDTVISIDPMKQGRQEVALP